MKNRWMSLVAVVVGSWLSSPAALACAACFGQSDSAMAKGMNAGIFALLAFVFAAWIAFGSFFVFIVRRSRNMSEPLPGDQNDPQHN
jgi:hypothetical protein